MAGLEGVQLGEYRILRRLSNGGMGDIYIAEQAALGRRVAVKVVREERIADARAREEANRRFIQEARAVAALEHPHILPIYGYGEQDGIHYFAMQYVPDGSLADLLSPGPLHRFDLPVETQLVIALIDQAAEALQYAHDRGVVHRDVKPHNLLVRVLSWPAGRRATSTLEAGEQEEPPIGPPRLHVLLADFGLARFLDSFTGRTGTIGTPLYSAPEQYSGQPKPPTDQYALACVAYLMLAGRPVFDGTVLELHHQHLVVPPPPITRANSALPAALDAVLLRALAKEPYARYATIRGFAEALHAALEPATQNRSQPSGARMTTDGIGVSASPPLPEADSPRVAPMARAPMPTSTVALPHEALHDDAAYSLGATAPTMGPPAPLSLDGMPRMPSVYAPSSRPLTSTLVGHDTATVTSAGLPGVSPLRSSFALTQQSPDATRTGLSSPHSPDAPGAPIPRVRKQHQHWGPLPVSRRIALVCLTVLVVTLLGSYAWSRATYAPPKAQMASVVSVQVSHSAQMTVARLPHLANGQYPVQSTLPLRGLPGKEGVGADHLATLPAQAPTMPAPAALPKVLADQSKFGLGQNQVGTSSPVDASVASSDHYVIEGVDGALQFYGYNGLTDGPTISAGAFFAPLVQPHDTLGELHVYFDATDRHWVLVANELEIQAGAVTNGFFDIAISQSDQPLASWTLYQLSTQEGSAAGCTWADDPRIGSDAAGIYLTGNSFQCGDASTFRGAILWDLPKKSFEEGSGKSAWRWSGVFKNSKRQPVLGVVPATQSGSEGTEWLVSNDTGYTRGGVTSQYVIVWALLNSGIVEKGGIPTLVGVVTPLPVAYADPPAAIQPNSSGALATGDARITSASVVGQHLYTAFTTAVNWRDDDATRAGVYWADIVTQVNGPTPKAPQPSIGARVAQSGILGFVGGYTFYPALGADSLGDIVVTANSASSGAAPGVIYSRHLASDSANSMGAGNTTGYLAQGTQPYPGAHWGDFLGISVSALSADGQTVAVWVAGSYMEDFPAHWQTLVWELPLRRG